MYRRGNKSKIITSLVLVAVLTISIGYAAFSNTLRITPQATITPDSANFDIDFSKVSTGVDASDVTPSLTGTGITAKAAEIDNSTSPTITNLSVEFTEPGQKAEYSFYAYNNGQYLAYLNSINFINPEGKDAFITCTADSSDTHYVDDACKGIKVSIKIVPTDSSIETITTDVTKENISGHRLAKTSAEQVIVTIEYESGSARADGSFSVDIGDITLVYTTVDSTSVATTKACTYDGELVAGATFSDGGYTYKYKQENDYAEGWRDITEDGWGVIASSTITSDLCTTINDKPIVSMMLMFYEYAGETIDVSNFDTSNVVRMSGMFWRSSATEIIGLTNLDTKNVTNMSYMFAETKVSILDLSNFDTSSLKYYNDMFTDTSATIGYAKTQADADLFNKSNNTGIPSTLVFTVK